MSQDEPKEFCNEILILNIDDTVIKQIESLFYGDKQPPHVLVGAMLNGYKFAKAVGYSTSCGKDEITEACIYKSVYQGSYIHGFSPSAVCLFVFSIYQPSFDFVSKLDGVITEMVKKYGRNTDGTYLQHWIEHRFTDPEKYMVWNGFRITTANNTSNHMINT